MISITDLKTALRVDLVNAAQDAYILALEAAAVQYVEMATGNSYSAGVGTVEYARGTGSDRLYVAAAFTTPAVLERAYPGAVDTTAITDFVLRDGYLLRTGGLVWTSGYEYEITGDTGYAAGTEPPIARTAVTMLVAHWFEYRMPALSGTITQEVPLSVKELLEILTHYPVA